MNMMEYSYLALLVLIAIFISFYINKKNKAKELVHQPNNSELENRDNTLEENTSTIDLEEDDDNKSNSFNYYKYEIIYYWITQKVNPNKNIDYEKLKEKILSKIGNLPEILEDDTSYLNNDSKHFLKEVLGKIEYSPRLKYLLVTKSRQITSFLKTLFSIVGFVFFIKFQILIRQVSKEDLKYTDLIISITSFILSAICKKLSEKIFTFMLCKMKPGDYLRIIYSHDEIIEKEVKINQLSQNETMFNKTTIHQSRNQLICEKFLELSSTLPNTINNKMCLYLVLNFLKTKYSQESYRDYLLEKEINTLEFISAFNPNSITANYELCMRYFESEMFDDFYESLLKCRSINGYDWVIEATIKSYEFYNENCGKLT